jgi:nucleotide-binding universal stress UspA family protein
MSIPIDWVHLENSKEMYPDVTKKVNMNLSELDSWVAKAEKNGVNAKRHLCYDESTDAMIRALKNFKCDMIIIGSHGASGPRELLIGSVAQKIVRNSPEPVLVIKPGTESIRFKKIAFLSAFKDDCLGKFRQVAELARELSVYIDLVYINTPYDFISTPDMESRMKMYEDEAPDIIENKLIYNFEDFEDGLVSYSKEYGIDCVAMVTHGKKNLPRIFSGSFTESVVNHLNIPVLSLNLGS